MHFKNQFNRNYRFHFLDDQSPTHHQLAQFMQSFGFKRTKWAFRAHFSERNLNVSPELCECLEFKHRLAQMVQHYCPTVMPETHMFNEFSWSTSLSDIANTHYTTGTLQFNDKVDDLAWILKPALLNNGQHIKIFDRLSQMEAYLLSSNRLGGPHVLQRYISNPDLFDGRKYSLRFFVVITQEAGAFLYQQGYLNVAKANYNANDFTDLSAHLTNEHLINHVAPARAGIHPCSDSPPGSEIAFRLRGNDRAQDSSSVVQIPTADVAGYSSWYPQIQSIVKAVTTGLESAFPHAFVAQKERTFAVFGFDFMLDSQQRAWLLEVNHGPCFPIEEHHPLQQTLYRSFWEAMVQKFVLPIATNQPMDVTGSASFESMRSI